MHYSLLQFLILLSIAFMLIMLAQKLKIAYPVFLVVAGLLISYIPGIPVVTINPELIFLIFLPPLLYEAAWYTSWNDFWKWKRPISLLAFGLVIFTSTIIAFVSSHIIPGFSLPMGFLLGGIISPPDAVAASSVLKNIKLPKRITTILEGESLVNDASGLIIFRFALAAILTGQFSFHQAVSGFFIVTIMGIVSGLAVAYIVYLIHRFFPTTPSIDTAFTLVSPYFMYLAAEQFHFSGVLSVISGGLFLSYHSHEILVNGQSRLQTAHVWATLVVILNGLVFILIGLELPVIVKGLNGYSLAQAWKFGGIITLITILIRMILIFPSTFVPRWLFKSIRTTEPSPGWKGAFIIGWSGMRGVVSLASALSLPMLTLNGEAFPNRNLIIFITFVVILITLVFQGLSLPVLIKIIKIKELDPAIPDEQQEVEIKIDMINVALNRLGQNVDMLKDNELLAGYRTELLNSMSHHEQRLHCLECGASGQIQMDLYNKMLKEIYHFQRKELHRFRKEKKYSDNNIRRHELLIDLNEVKTNNHSR